MTPPDVHDEIGTASWAWVDALFEPGESDPTFGWLNRADAEVRDDLAELDLAVAEAVAAEQYRSADAFRLQKATLRRTQLLNFLARRNVLSKYGFPVDVVPLDLARTGDKDAARLELDRDLRVAISEYAPGGEVVAAKAVWTCPVALTKGSNPVSRATLPSSLHVLDLLVGKLGRGVWHPTIAPDSVARDGHTHNCPEPRPCRKPSDPGDSYRDSYRIGIEGRELT